MVKRLSILTVCLGLLSACDDDSTLASGLDLLGEDFARAFAQDRNDEPLPLAGFVLQLAPEREPFNP